MLSHHDWSWKSIERSSRNHDVCLMVGQVGVEPTTREV